MSCRQIHGDSMVSELVAEENVVGTSRRGWHTCDSCGNLKPKTAFGHSAWHNKASPTQKSLRVDCSIHLHQCDLCQEVK
eukprot:6656105-Karenia_brevis.AAC.1